MFPVHPRSRFQSDNSIFFHLSTESTGTKFRQRASEWESRRVKIKLKFLLYISYVGLTIYYLLTHTQEIRNSYVGDSKSNVGASMSYAGNSKSYVAVDKSYVGVDRSYVWGT